MVDENDFYAMKKLARIGLILFILLEPWIIPLTRCESLTANCDNERRLKYAIPQAWSMGILSRFRNMSHSGIARYTEDRLKMGIHFPAA